MTLLPQCKHWRGVAGELPEQETYGSRDTTVEGNPDLVVTRNSCALGYHAGVETSLLAPRSEFYSSRIPHR